MGQPEQPLDLLYRGEPGILPLLGYHHEHPHPNTRPWYDCNWGYRRRITIDHNQVNGTQTNFPVLISLASDSGLQSHAKATGDDIFFTAPTGTSSPTRSSPSRAAPVPSSHG